MNKLFGERRKSSRGEARAGELSLWVETARCGIYRVRPENDEIFLSGLPNKVLFSNKMKHSYNYCGCTTRHRPVTPERRPTVSYGGRGLKATIVTRRCRTENIEIFSERSPRVKWCGGPPDDLGGQGRVRIRSRTLRRYMTVGSFRPPQLLYILAQQAVVPV